MVTPTVRVCLTYDECPDTSYLGEVSARYSVGDLPYPDAGTGQARDRRGHPLWFAPQVPLSAAPRGEYMARLREAKADRARFAALERGEWAFLCLTVRVQVDREENGRTWTTEECASLGGIESDSGRAFFEDEARALLGELAPALSGIVTREALDIELSRVLGRL